MKRTLLLSPSTIITLVFTNNRHFKVVSGLCFTYSSVERYACNYNAMSTPPISLRLSSSSSATNEGIKLQTIQPLKEEEEEHEPMTQIIKKSRFVSYAFHAHSKNQIQDVIEKIKQEHIKSRHVCYAYVIGDSNSNTYEERANDDGEPVGTAGLPILGAIKGENLVDTCCIVVRYYGGIKLGAGGLIRAYGSSARLSLRDSPKITYQPKTIIQLRTIPMKYIGSIYTLLQRHTTSVCTVMHEGEEEYTDKGDIVLLKIMCSIDHVEDICESLNDLTRGEVEIACVGK